jgi:hypothetical protein
MDYFPRKSLSKYLIKDTIYFNKHVHDIDIFINDKWRKYAGSDIGRLFNITRRLELRFWPTRKRSQPSQGDFFARIALQREPWIVGLKLLITKGREQVPVTKLKCIWKIQLCATCSTNKVTLYCRMSVKFS